MEAFASLAICAKTVCGISLWRVTQSSGWIVVATANLARRTSTASRIQEKLALIAVVPIAQLAQNCVAMVFSMDWKSRWTVEVRIAKYVQLARTVKSMVRRQALIVVDQTANPASATAIAQTTWQMAWSNTSIVVARAVSHVKHSFRGSTMVFKTLEMTWQQLHWEALTCKLLARALQVPR